MKSESQLAVLLFWSAFNPAYAIATSATVEEVLIFEGIAPEGRGSPFLENGFFVEGSYRVFTPDGQWVDSETEDVGVDHPDNGTDWFVNNNKAPITISHVQGLPRFLNAFDATEFDIPVTAQLSLRASEPTVRRSWHRSNI